MIVYCREHSLAHGVVRRNPVGGFVEFRFRDPRLHAARDAALGFDDRDTSGERLEERTVQMVQSKGCRDCGVRDLPIAALVEAFEEGRAKVSL